MQKTVPKVSSCGPLWSGELRRLYPSTLIFAGLFPAKIGSRCDAPSSPVALVTRAAAPESTPQPGGFFGLLMGYLFLHCTLDIKFSRGHCGQSGKQARQDREKRCDRMIVGPSSDESGGFALSVLTQGECLVFMQRRQSQVVAIQPMRKNRNFKGGDVHHCQEMPVFGQTGSRWVGPRRGKISVACDQADSGRWG